MKVNKEILINNLNQLRKSSPLVHNITNYVVMNNTANALLAIGASPIMAHATNEMEDMVAIVSALVINIGTLNDEWVNGMLIAGKAAKLKNIPIILDPVGAGATPYRTDVCLKIIKECQPDILRGNASEVMALNNSNIKTKGVDSSVNSDCAIEAAKSLANEYNMIVSISGETDYITNGNEIIEVTNGTEMMTKVTGLGCSASALTGAFAAINRDYLQAAANAMAIMGIAGEIALSKSRGPGSLQMNFIDELYLLSEKEINQYLK
ncbi:MAG: hydroxyethylthiazole kinase [Bacteroidales bacterium]|jgi:hydroxyethylthiazole kinase|nr:hydroxyethylthiazole kinase [Bacteroidales bacterium]